VSIFVSLIYSNAITFTALEISWIKTQNSEESQKLTLLSSVPKATKKIPTATVKAEIQSFFFIGTWKIRKSKMIMKAGLVMLIIKFTTRETYLMA